MPRPTLSDRPMTAAERAQRYRARRRAEDPLTEEERILRRIVTTVIQTYIREVRAAAEHPKGAHYLGPQARQRLAKLLGDVAGEILGATWADQWKLRETAENIFVPRINGGRMFTAEANMQVLRWVEDRLPRMPLRRKPVADD